MAFIRKVKTKSGATAVQVAYTADGKIIRIYHIVSDHNEEDVATLLNLAKQKLNAAQRSLFDPEPSQLEVGIQQAISTVLLDVLKEQYAQLGFDQLADEDFQNLCIARLVEPTSKLDSVRVLADLGMDSLNKDRLHRCLKRVIADNYRDKLAKLCFAHASQGVGITLVLYDVTTLYFETREREADDYRKPGMSKERRLEPQILVGLLVDESGVP